MKLLQHLFTTPRHGLNKTTRAYFTEHICSKFQKEKLLIQKIRLVSSSLFSHVYLTVVNLLFYLFSQQNIGIRRFLFFFNNETIIVVVI